MQNLLNTLPPVKQKNDKGTKPASSLSLAIIWHDDLDRVGAYTPCQFDGEGCFYVNRYEPLFQSSETHDHLPLYDARVSRKPITIKKVGAKKYRIEAPDSPMDVKLIGASADNIIELSDENDTAYMVISHSIILALCFLPQEQCINPHNSLVGITSAMDEVRRHIRLYANKSYPVMVTGETGTGKELTALDLHHNSDRANNAFVAVNMATLLPDLAVAELFGSQKGAFTGAAHDRLGYFSQANAGTLFCDEIGDTPHNVQSMMLRALETGHIHPLGYSGDMKVDVRIIAATDRLIDEHYSENSFSKPLYHRLTAAKIEMPPLRNRPVDITLLLKYFFENSDMKPSQDIQIPTDVLLQLLTYDWPGNVRELKNISYKLMLSEKPQLTMQESFPDIQRNKMDKQVYRSHHSISETELLEALDQHNWLIKPAADSLNISRTSCYELIKNSTAIRHPEEIDTAEIQQALKEGAHDIVAMCKELRVPQSSLKTFLNRTSGTR